METSKPRTLTADEIAVRVKTWDKTGHKWAMMLLYKDARCDMRILDETYGPDGWQREHQLIDGKLYCTISIWSEKLQQWVKKQDVGTESEIDKEKGNASDAFKRAAYNVGIGRELYTAPRIYIKTTEEDYRGGNLATELVVTKVEYNAKREIKALELKDISGNVRFTYPTKNNKAVANNETDIEDEDLNLAIDDIKRANSLADLSGVAARWQCYMTNQRFIEAGKRKRTELMQNV